MKNKAFTLVELLVVIAIIAVLVSILIPAFAKAKMQARLVLCANNQHQILLGLKQYQNDYEMKLPPSIQGVYWQGREYWEEPFYITCFADPINSTYYPIRMGGGCIGLQLARYLPDANIFHCPASPLDTRRIIGRNGESYQDIYRTGIGQDRVMSNYWLLWNYGGWAERCQWSNQEVDFKPFGGAGDDTLMIADMMLYWPHLEPPLWFLNHKPMDGASIIRKDSWYSPGAMFWNILDYGGDTNYTIPETFFNAGYLDGHVEKYASTDCYLFNLPSSSKWFIPSKWR